MPILDDMPLEERVRRGNVLIGVAPARRRGNAAAVDQRRRPDGGGRGHPAVAEQKIWSLADDIEHVLAHRDAQGLVRVRGRLVGAGRAAHARGSTALAVERAAARRRSGGASRRVADLRHHVGRRAVPHRGLGQAGPLRRQHRALPGGAVARRDPVPARRDRDGHATARARRPRPCRTAALGFEEVVQNKPMRASARTSGRAICLALTIEECRGAARREPRPGRGSLPHDPRRPRPSPPGRRSCKGTGEDAVQLAGDGLSPIEKVMALQRISTFSHFRTDELLALANAARARPVGRGRHALRRGRAAGAVHPDRRRGGPRAAPDGPAAGRRPGRRHRRSTSRWPDDRSSGPRGCAPGVALRIDRDDLYDASATGPHCCSSCSRRCSARAALRRRRNPHKSKAARHSPRSRGSDCGVGGPSCRPPALADTPPPPPLVSSLSLLARARAGDRIGRVWAPGPLAPGRTPVDSLPGSHRMLCPDLGARPGPVACSPWKEPTWRQSLTWPARCSTSRRPRSTTRS